MTLPQLSPLGRWQLDLPHDRAEHLLIWITRGQGVALLNGARAGLGVHNAIFIPARHLMALDLGRQSFGQALVVPGLSGIDLPQRALLLRIRDVSSQNELTGLFEAMGREQTGGRPFSEDAIRAHAQLVGVWLRRQMAAEPPPARIPAARRLTRAYFSRLVSHYATGAGMADHAEALGVTPTHLTRVCKSETGQTAAALMTGRILHAARLLLATTRMPAQDIARDLGFNSAAYFSRFMQHHTGMSPSNLRRATS